MPSEPKATRCVQSTRTHVSDGDRALGQALRRLVGGCQLASQLTAPRPAKPWLSTSAAAARPAAGTATAAAAAACAIIGWLLVALAAGIQCPTLCGASRPLAHHDPLPLPRKASPCCASVAPAALLPSLPPASVPTRPAAAMPSVRFRHLLCATVLCVGIVPQVALWATSLNELAKATRALAVSEAALASTKTGEWLAPCVGAFRRFAAGQRTRQPPPCRTLPPRSCPSAYCSARSG
jgi:hypothetical protein